MKILAFTDIHADPASFALIKKKIRQENPELVVCCGDISNFAIDLEFAVKQILSFGKKTLLIPGNHETADEIRRVAEKHPEIIDLHNSFFTFKDVTFYGYGTGGFSQRDVKFEKKIPFLKKKLQGKKWIFVTHAPIYGTKLDDLWMGHCGNKSARKFVEEVNPFLVVCGHFHENEKKQDKIKNSKIVNPGHEGMLLEI